MPLLVQLVCASIELPGTMSNSLRVHGKSDYSSMLRWQSASWMNAAVMTKFVYAKKSQVLVKRFASIAAYILSVGFWHNYLR